MKKLTVILFILVVTFLTTRPVDSPEGFKPKPRLITQNETHEFYEEPQTHTIIKVNKRTGEAVDLQKLVNSYLNSLYLQAIFLHFANYPKFIHILVLTVFRLYRYKYMRSH